MKAWAVAALGISVSIAMPAAAQSPYPTRTVKLVVGAAPGGNPDVLGRMMAQRLSDLLGQPFVIENVPGAGGVVGAQGVAKATPDGHTLMLGDSGALAIAGALTPNLGYDPLKDFTPITALATVPTIMVSPPSVTAGTLSELIALARKKPAKLSYGSAGQGSIHHLTMGIFSDRTGINLLHVPYRGGAAMVQGLMTGEVQLGWSGIPNILPLINTGKLRGYCISILERSKAVPQIATCDELGEKGFNVASMIGLQGPAGLPSKIVELMQGTVAKILREPALSTRMVELGMVMQENGTAHYTQHMKDDVARYAEAVRKLKIDMK